MTWPVLFLVAVLLLAAPALAQGLPSAGAGEPATDATPCTACDARHKALAARLAALASATDTPAHPCDPAAAGATCPPIAAQSEGQPHD